MKTKVYKVRDVVDCLVVGATYTAAKSGRMIRFINEKTGVVLHLYPHQVEHAIARGRLVELDQHHSENWTCKLCQSVCKCTPNGFAY